MKRFVLSVLAGLAAYGTASAAEITFDLSDVTFSDGGTATGSFIVDFGQSGALSLVSYDIATTMGTVLAGTTYETGAVQDAATLSSTELALRNLSSPDISSFVLPFAAISSTTTSEPIVDGAEFDFEGIRSVEEGGIVNATPPSPVPLPASAWLMLSGVLALGGFGRRHMAACIAA